MGENTYEAPVVNTLDEMEMVQIQMYSRRDWFGRQKLPLHMHMH